MAQVTVKVNHEPGSVTAKATSPINISTALTEPNGCGYQYESPSIIDALQGLREVLIHDVSILNSMLSVVVRMINEEKENMKNGKKESDSV